MRGSGAAKMRQSSHSRGAVRSSLRAIAHRRRANVRQPAKRPGPRSAGRARRYALLIMSRAMSTTRIQEGERCVLRLAGDLDTAASQRLAQQVTGEPAQQLLLDFFAVASIDDRGLAELADALRLRPQVTLRGLREHQ